MMSWISRLRQTSRDSRPLASRTHRPALEPLERRDLLDANTIGFAVTNLLSDMRGIAEHTNRALINPWGFAETPDGQFEIAANGSGDALRVNAEGQVIGKPVPLQPPLGSPPGTATSPNGTVLNTTSDFVISDDGKSAPAQFIFSTEDGTIVGFNPQVDKKEGILAAQASDGAVYKLLAEAPNAMGNFLFATDFHNNKIDVFDKNFDKVTLGQGGWGTFTDPNEPDGFAPFGVKLVNLNGQNVLFVTYAKQKGPDNHDDQEGPGNGFINIFTTTGEFIKRFATGTAVIDPNTGQLGDAPLNSPIGAAIAPAGFGPGGKFGGALLIGNFGDSHVTAFDLQTGQVLGQLTDVHGNPLTLNGGVGDPAGSKGLWGIAFGNGKGGTDPNTLYFNAGINNEADGLFGAVQQVERHRRHGHGFDHEGGNASLAVGSSPVNPAIAGQPSHASTTGEQTPLPMDTSSNATTPTSMQSLSQAVHTDALSPLVFHRKVLDQIFTEMSDTPAG